MSRSSRRARGAIVLALVALTGTLLLATPASAGAPRAPVPLRLRVMTFNIEYGGTVIDFDKIVAAVRRAKPDVVGFEESYGHIPRLARALGWGHVNGRTDVLSRYPVVDPPGADGHYVYLELAPGEVAAIANVHLPSGPYSPRLILNGSSRRQVLETERRVRVPAIEPVLAALSPVVGAGVPTFLVGDFNAPSRLDWTDATVGLRPQIRFAVNWPVSRMVEHAGFVDSYRASHRNPVSDPGLTWPARRPRSDDSWNPPRDAPRDRIDYVYAAGPVTTVGSQVVGERGGPGVTFAVHPWGSDHRGVVSTFDVTPAPPPVLVATDRRLLAVGRDVTVTYHAPGNPGEQVVIVPEGGDPATDTLAAQNTPGGAPVDGALVFPTGSLSPGGYDAVLVGAGNAELSRTTFWTRAAGSPPVVDTATWKVAPGAPIRVLWHAAPGNRFDWIGIYPRGADPRRDSYYGWAYTAATIDGSLSIGGGAVKGWPLPPGRYTVILLIDDSYRQIARADFVIG